MWTRRTGEFVTNLDAVPAYYEKSWPWAKNNFGMLSYNAFSLRITSAGTRRQRTEKGSWEAAKYFSAPDVVLFSAERSVNSRIQTFVRPRGGKEQRVRRRFLHWSFRSLIETATFFYGISIHFVLHGAFPTKSAAGAIYATRVRQEGKRVTWVWKVRDSADRNKQS